MRTAILSLDAEIEKSRASALGLNYEGSDDLPKGSYEGGSAVASSSSKRPVASLLSAEVDGNHALQQSLHVAQTSSMGDRIRSDRDDTSGPTGSTTSPRGHAKTDPASLVSEKKVNALGDLEGKTLGCFGDLLLQLLHTTSQPAHG